MSVITAQRLRAARRQASRTGEPVVLASGTHDGVAWQHEVNRNTDYYRLTYNGGACQTAIRGRTPQQAAAEHKADVDAAPARQAEHEATRAQVIEEYHRVMFARDKRLAAQPALSEVEDAYRKGTGSNPTKSMLIRWASHSVSDQDQASRWYRETFSDTRDR